MRKIVIIMVGMVCIIVGILIMTSHFKNQKIQTADATATIIRIDSEIQTDSDGIDTRWYYPIVKYSVGGKDYEAKLSNSGTTNSTEFKEGDIFEIKYNPDQPQECSKKGDNGGLWGGIFFIVIGIIMTIATFFGRF